MEYARLSFLDLLGDGPNTPLRALEPAYIDGSTLVAVWPSSGPMELVKVMTWTPDAATLEELRWLHVDWAPAMCDVMVRCNNLQDRTHIRPCGTSNARRAAIERGAIAEAIRHELDRGSRVVGRAFVLAA
ncbi:MAG: hypothetical protein ABMA64_01055 [Myxococcota bacterium]